MRGGEGGGPREECRKRWPRDSFSSGFSAEARDKDKLARQVVLLQGRYVTGAAYCHSTAVLVAVSLNSAIGRGTRTDLEKFIPVRQIIHSREISGLHSGYGSGVTSRRIV